MSILSIHVNVECDECGSHFRVSMDPTDELQSLIDAGVTDAHGLAEDAIRGASEYESIAPKSPDRWDELMKGLIGSSVQNDKHLCAKCTTLLAAHDTQQAAQSWYGGEVDRDVVRAVVELKEAQQAEGKDSTAQSQSEGEG